MQVFFIDHRRDAIQVPGSDCHTFHLSANHPSHTPASLTPKGVKSTPKRVNAAPWLQHTAAGEYPPPGCALTWVSLGASTGSQLADCIGVKLEAQRQPQQLGDG